MGDLKSTKAIYFKAFLFFVSGAVAVSLLILQNASLQTAFLIGVAIWSFCRLYYFMFYVIEKYVDPSFRFSGIIPCLLYLMKRRNDHSKAGD